MIKSSVKRILPIALILALLIAAFLTRERLLPFGRSLACDAGNQLSALGLRKAPEEPLYTEAPAGGPSDGRCRRVSLPRGCGRGGLCIQRPPPKRASSY